MDTDLIHLAQKHYENFPVGSRFIPKRYREPIHLIYAFARVADDIADEGTLPPEERIRQLNEWEEHFLHRENGGGNNGFFRKLSETIRRYELPPHLFINLLKAFKQDSANPVYHSFDEILDYCQYSANPIGRILLKIFRSSNEGNDSLSDAICTALQLTNFWQDISVDTRRNRFYIPLTDLRQIGLNFADLHGEKSTAGFRLLMQMYVEQTRGLFLKGKPLIGRVHKDFRFELKLIWHGGMRILEKIESQGYDTRILRPALTMTDTLLILFRALRT